MTVRFKILVFLTFNLVFLLIFLSPREISAQKLDTLLIKDLKDFFYLETGFTLKGDFFTKWAKHPRFIRYVSLPDRIECPPEIKNYNETCDDEIIFDAEKKLLLPDSNNYQIMNYRVPADADCKIRPEFPTYSSDGLAFAIFHELMHNYIRQKKIRIPSVYEEAVCDIMGDYCTLAFAEHDKRINKKAAIRQIRINDSIYSSINRCITEINDNPDFITETRKKCSDEIHHFLGKANKFQKFRFGYEVNNGFLLKCRDYSWTYFIFKKIFLEQGSIRAFVDVLAQLNDIPDNLSPAVKNYQKELFLHTGWAIDVTVDWHELIAALKDSNQLYIRVFNCDPVNIYLEVLNSNADSIKITPEVCMASWNEIIKGINNKTRLKSKNFMLAGNSNWGISWLVTTAFEADGHIMCWDEEVHLQPGREIKVKLSKDNATYIEVQKKK